MVLIKMGSPRSSWLSGESGGSRRLMTWASFFATGLPNALKSAAFHMVLWIGILAAELLVEQCRVACTTLFQ